MSKVRFNELVNSLAEEARRFRKSNFRKETFIINGVSFLLRMDLEEKHIVVSTAGSISFLMAETSRMEYRAFFDNLLKGIFGSCAEFDCKLEMEEKLCTENRVFTNMLK